MLTLDQIPGIVQETLNAQPVVDMHTHLYAPAFGTPVQGRGSRVDPGGLLLWGIDELVTYHYMVAEVFRVVPARRFDYQQFWKMTKSEQADHIWKNLFVENAPVSEACRGVLTVLQKLGLDPNEKNLDGHRKWFAQQNPDQYIDKVMQISGVEKITMTNPVFDDNERQRWMENPGIGDDPRFDAVLRIDPLLRQWENAAKKLTQWGYAASEIPDATSIENARQFIRDWIKRQKAIYLAVSLPPDFRYPSENAGTRILDEVVLPVCREFNLPFAMMIGSRLRVNPSLGDAGDMVGKSDIISLTNILAANPDNRFFVTMLARENQHELCVAARKFGNLMPFGCWWFTNNPSIIDEITRMRFELLGTTFIPQHSDARVLDQLIYKWTHSRHIIGQVLADKFVDIARAGCAVTQPMIAKTCDDLFRGNFQRFVAGKSALTRFDGTDNLIERFM